MSEIGRPRVEEILHRLEAAYEHALSTAHAWSESPDRDVATAIWGECVGQAGAWIWRRSGDIVFKLSEARRIPGVGKEDLSIYETHAVEIVLNGEEWERYRKDRIVWTREHGWRPGPWWNWIEDFASPDAVNKRLASEKQIRSAAWRRRLDDELAFENGLIEAWSKRHPAFSFPR